MALRPAGNTPAGLAYYSRAMLVANPPKPRGDSPAVLNIIQSVFTINC